MKLKRLLSGLTAAALAVSVLASSAVLVTAEDTETDIDITPAPKAKSLYDFVTPEDDAFWAVGGMGFYQGQDWAWHDGSGEWGSMGEDGILDMYYTINPDDTLPGENTLGAMGFKVANIDPSWFPLEVSVLDCTWQPDGGEEIHVKSLIGTHTVSADPTGDGTDFRFYMRPNADPDHGIAATPEFAGTDEPGSFEGGVLYMKIDFNPDRNTRKIGDAFDVPFTVAAPTNVAVLTAGSDSPNTLNIAYSQNESMSAWAARAEDPEQHDTVVAELAEMGYDDFWINAQIDWAIDDPTDWYSDEYWLSDGTNKRYQDVFWDTAYIWMNYSSNTVNDEWIFRFGNGIDEPDNRYWFGWFDDEGKQISPGWKDVLTEDQYDVLTYEGGEHYAKIDFTKHTAYFRVRWIITARPKDDKKLYVDPESKYFHDEDDPYWDKPLDENDLTYMVMVSDWSNVASYGKDAVNVEPLKPGDVDAPVISDLQMLDEMDEDYAMVGFKLDVSDKLNKQLTDVTAMWGTIWFEVEAKLRDSNKWSVLAGDWIIKSGDMKASLRNLIADNPNADLNKPIQLRARYWVDQGDPTFYTDYSDIIEYYAFVLGDVNGNGVCNMEDYALLQRWLASWEVPIIKTAADLNFDGDVNMLDYALFQRKLAGWET